MTTPPPPDEPRAESTLLRDRLAIDRTLLANERTLLAYIRTALALAVVGASGLRFFDTLAIHAAGWLFVAAGVALLAIGGARYRVVARGIGRARSGAR